MMAVLTTKTAAKANQKSGNARDTGQEVGIGIDRGIEVETSATATEKDAAREMHPESANVEAGMVTGTTRARKRGKGTVEKRVMVTGIAIAIRMTLARAEQASCHRWRGKSWTTAALLTRARVAASAR